MTKKIQLANGNIYEMKELSKQLQNHITGLSIKLENMQVSINNELGSAVIEIGEIFKKIDSIIKNATAVSDFAEHLERIKNEE